MSFDDAGHRPHASHKGEDPSTGIDRGPEGIIVKLDAWGPENFQIPMAQYLQANWGEAPLSREDADSPKGRAWVQAAFDGKTLQQVLEGITFWFTIDGVTRACTHQLVRSRFAAFMQHGGRDNDWRHRKWSMPETIFRAVCENKRASVDVPISCIVDWRPILDYLSSEEVCGVSCMRCPDLEDAIHAHLDNGKRLYAALVDAGIPWQDARRLLPIGTQTYIHGIFNYVSLRDLLNKRLEHVMDWEINCVAQLMLREVRLQCPPVIGMSLKSLSDRTGWSEFSGLDSWAPDGKYPSRDEVCECGHAAENHWVGMDAEHGIADRGMPNTDPEVWCTECTGNGGGCLSYRPVDRRKRTHRPEQNPFWVLAPECFTDPNAPIRWIPTDGRYPHTKLP